MARSDQCSPQFDRRPGPYAAGVNHGAHDGREREASSGLVVVPVPAGDDAWAAATAAAAATKPEPGLAPTALVVALPAERAVLQGELSAVHDLLAEQGWPVVRDPSGRVVVGLAGVLAPWVGRSAPADLAVDHEGLLVHAWSPHDGSSLVLHGRILAAATSTEPPVVVAAEAGELAAALAADTSADLVRILRYDDAVDPDDEWRTVADEVLDVAFWTPAFCATVVRAAEAAGAFTPDDEDPVPGHEVSLASLSPALFDAVEQHVAAAVMPVVHQVWPYVDYHGLRDAFVIKYAPGVQTELRIHHDVAQLSGSVLLNAGYDGCRLEFPRQGYDNVDMAVGRLLVWPSLVTHPHRATALTGGVKYALTLWFELPAAPPLVSARLPIVTR